MNIISNLLNMGKFFKLFFRKLGRVWSLHGGFTVLEWVARAPDRIQLALTWQWELPLLIVVHFQLILTLPLGGGGLLLYLEMRNSLGLRRQHSPRPQGWAGDPSPSLSLSSRFSFLGPQNMPSGYSRTLDTSANPRGFTSLNCTRWLGLVFLPTPCYFLFIFNLGSFSGMKSDGIQLTDGRHSPEEAVSIAGLQKAHTVTNQGGPYCINSQS